jgi:hypothetical protein
MPKGRSILAAVAIGALGGALYATWSTVQVALGQAPMRAERSAASGTTSR